VTDIRQNLTNDNNNSALERKEEQINSITVFLEFQKCFLNIVQGFISFVPFFFFDIPESDMFA
jgi:hypothetical protein